MISLTMEHVKVNERFHQNTAGGVLMMFNVMFKVYA
jgi:hypothetical protein